MIFLKRQIVRAVFLRRSGSIRSDWLNGRLRRNSSISSGRLRGEGHCSRLCAICGSLRRGKVYMDNIPRTHTVVPPSLIFMGTDVERHTHFITQLDIELREAICSKHVKRHLLGILVMGFYNKRLGLPLSSLRDAASFRQNDDDFSL